jgi:hypothetical protein
LGGNGFYTSCTGNGGQPENWGADFVAWDWAQEGIDTTGLLTTHGGATPATFAKYGGPNGAMHTSPVYVPQPGDAIVYDNPPDYVAIVTSVNADGSIQTTNGDWGGEGPGASNVQTVTLPSGQTTAGSTPDPMNGKTIAGYVTPNPASGANPSLTPYGAITWTPPGSTTPQVDIYAADSAGALWDFSHAVGSSTTLGTPRQVANGWTHYRRVGVADMDHDGYPDLVVIDTTTSNMVVFRGSATGLVDTPVFLGDGWSSDFTPFGIVDWTHKGHFGIVAVQNDNSDMYFYPGDLSGGVGARTEIGDGWSSVFTPVGVTDYTGDGHADILTCRTDNNTVMLYNGDGTGGSKTITPLATCANKTIFGVTDYTGDGHPDLITRDNATGTVTVAPSSLEGLGTVIATGDAATRSLTPFAVYSWSPPGGSGYQSNILAVDTNGNLLDYAQPYGATASPLSTTPTVVETGWTHYRPVGVLTFAKQAYPNIVAIDTNTNDLVAFPYTSTGWASTPNVLATGWTSNLTPMGISYPIIASGAEGYTPSISAVEHDNNTLVSYLATPTGVTKSSTGTPGWTTVDTPVGTTRVAGGLFSVLTCRSDTGSLQLYSQNETGGGFQPPTELSTGCTGDSFFGVGDYESGSGKPDVIVRDNATGDIIAVPTDFTASWNNSVAPIATNW